MRPIGLATGSSNFPLSYKSPPFSRPRCPSVKQRVREPERGQKFSPRGGRKTLLSIWPLGKQATLEPALPPLPPGLSREGWRAWGPPSSERARLRRRRVGASSVPDFPSPEPRGDQCPGPGEDARLPTLPGLSRVRVSTRDALENKPRWPRCALPRRNSDCQRHLDV